MTPSNWTALFWVLGLMVATPALESCRTTDAVEPQMSAASIWATVQANTIGGLDVKSRDIEVTTANGVVRLSGRDATRSESMKAERVARQSEGVRDVVNRLTVAKS